MQVREIDSESQKQALHRMAQAFMIFLRTNDGRFERLQEFELHLPLPRAAAFQNSEVIGGRQRISRS